MSIKYIADIDTDGNGLIEVLDWEDLNAMRYQTDGSGIRFSQGGDIITVGCPDDGCIGYELMNDLDFTADATAEGYRTATGWLPIGDVGNPFSTTFNGNNRTISNLIINNQQSDDIGFFGVISTNASIENIALLDAEIAGIDNVGILAGVNNDGSIVNSHATGEVSGEDAVGGLVGENRGGIVVNSYATGEVLGLDAVGGLVGENRGGIVVNSYATGEVLGLDAVGGLVGLNQAGVIVNSYAVVSEVSGTLDTGGLIGRSIAAGSKIYNSFSRGIVKANGSIQNIGGLVGRIDSTTISDSYSMVNVVNVNSEIAAAGVFVGRSEDSTISTIKNSYAMGRVEGGISSSLAGRFYGTFLSNDVFSNNYRDATVSGVAPNLIY